MEFSSEFSSFVVDRVDLADDGGFATTDESLWSIDRIESWEKDVSNLFNLNDNIDKSTLFFIFFSLFYLDATTGTTWLGKTPVGPEIRIFFPLKSNRKEKKKPFETVFLISAGWRKKSMKRNEIFFVFLFLYFARWWSRLNFVFQCCTTKNREKKNFSKAKNVNEKLRQTSTALVHNWVYSMCNVNYLEV